MPQSVSSICRQPGCRAVAAAGSGGRCPAHLGAQHADDRARRGNAAQRGYGVRHRWWRRIVLGRHPLCANPFKLKDHFVAATVADHIIPLRQGGDFSLENGQGLCARCHNRKTAAERKWRSGGVAK